MDRRILVVDDSELVCQQLSQLLAHPGRRIKVAHDGTTALEWLVEHVEVVDPDGQPIDRALLEPDVDTQESEDPDQDQETGES